MKTKLLLASFIVGAAFVAGCKPTPDKPEAQAASSTARQVDKAQVAVADAAQDMKDYAFEQKADYVAAMQVKLTALNRSLDELSATIESASDAVKKDARPKLAALRTQAADLKTQLDQVDGATASTWTTVKADFQKSLTAVKDGFTQARQWVSDKIAP